MPQTLEVKVLVAIEGNICWQLAVLAVVVEHIEALH